MKPTEVRLFIKTGCPWCIEAEDWLKENNIEYETLNVTKDPDAREEMQELSGQTKAPVIEVDGEILADFGADELAVFWERFE